MFMLLRLLLAMLYTIKDFQSSPGSSLCYSGSQVPGGSCFPTLKGRTCSFSLICLLISHMAVLRSSTSSVVEQTDSRHREPHLEAAEEKISKGHIETRMVTAAKTVMN